MADVVACDAQNLHVTFTCPVVKICPFSPEVDQGTVEISFHVNGQTMELHGLAAYLRAFAGQPVSHEDFTGDVHDYVSSRLDGMVRVVSRWRTAGGEVTCVKFSKPDTLDAVPR
jgi:NADPH-dependent 7-cyano-7-deazaguanine reductase QueF